MESKKDVEKLLSSSDTQNIIHGLVGMVNGIDDSQWVLEKLFKYSTHADYWVAKSSINGIGDLIRLDNEIKVEEIKMFLSSIKRDELNSVIDDLKDDINTFRGLDWKYIRDFLNKTLSVVQENLDQESIDFVNHYINHDEYEMAFEGLFLEIIKINKASNIDFVESKRIGSVLNLDKESVFDENFWERFTVYLNGKNLK